MKVGNILKTISEVTQYVPFVSVPMSLVNIFVKAVLSTQKGEPKNDYLKFVAKKSWGETLATPIPFVGGVVCCIARMAKDETSTMAKGAPVKQASKPTNKRPQVDLVVKPYPDHTKTVGTGSCLIA